MRTILIFLLLLGSTIYAQKKEADVRMNEETFKGIKWRNIGPAFTSGRISDIAIHPGDDHIWYVAVGSGGVWKTVNAGVTWTPIFDDQNSYSIGCVSIDPNNPHTIWVGTGENVGGRHVGYGDGVYKSLDGGKSWKNMGLKASEHISEIIIHPDRPDVIFVAAEGPLWKAGGERGLFKSVDGGVNWKQVLGDEAWTGVTSVEMDPRDPEVMYAATWQKARNVAMYLGGGPGSGIHKSTDGGETWIKLSKGLPGSRLGKIGLAVSPQNPDIVYAAIELDRRKGGFFMSPDRGQSWVKQSNTVSGATGPHYYQEIYASPHSKGRVYLMDVRVQVTDDHGKTFRRLEEANKHSDNHAIAFRKGDPDYLLMGTDGGVYESFDLAQTWRFMGNLPVTQYYKVAVDDRKPFYFVFGGTQDNGSHGGPSRTDHYHGIRSSEWTMILGGDGHQPATEPGNPDIVYAETQQGGLHRVDRITGEQLYIKPQAAPGEPVERFNWDAPILVSPHNPARIYFASHRIWRSDNRGDSWRAISSDLTRNQERFELPIMGKVQSWDNAWDIYAMSEYNTITSLAESPLREGLLYAGTDDGLIQVSEDGGANWRSLDVEEMNGVPETAFVNDLRADLFDANTVYAALDNHKFGDFTPYLLKSTDAGKSWKSIRGNLPDRTLVWRLVQDHIKPELLFVATEFGVYFTIDGGGKWIQLKNGVPTISIRDITIQRRENDLVAASFGRGFFILDDLSPLREVTEEKLKSGPLLFPVRDAWWYVPRYVSFRQGADHYQAENPPFGATFTYYLDKDLSTLKEKREKREKALEKTGADIPFPGWDSLEAERRQEDPKILLTVKDRAGHLVRKIEGKTSKGLHRTSWDLSHAPKSGIPLGGGGNSSGPTAVPGTYSVSLSSVVDGKVTLLAGPESFEVKPLREGALEGAGPDQIDAFRTSVEAFQQDITATNKVISKADQILKAMKQALESLDRDDAEVVAELHRLEMELDDIRTAMQGNGSLREVMEKVPAGPSARLSVAIRGLVTTYGPTPMHEQNLEYGIQQLGEIKASLKPFVEVKIPALERKLMDLGAPWIEGQGLID